MATSSKTNTRRSVSKKNEYRQVQVRMREILQRANALYERLPHSSYITDKAFHDIEQDYMAMSDEFQEQLSQLTQHYYNIQESKNKSNRIHKHSFSIPNSSRQTTNTEIYQMNPIVDDIENVLNLIVQQFKQYRFKPAYSYTGVKTTTQSMNDQYDAMSGIMIHQLYAVDLDILTNWVVASFERRLFFCNSDGDLRIFSYSRRFHRQPLLTERFHLSTIRLITSFTVTQDYLITFEAETQSISLYTHHGALLNRSNFPYDPDIIIRCDYLTKNEIWTCSQSKRQCIQFHIDHSTKEIHRIQQLNYKYPISNILIDPVGISSDEQHRIGVHDINTITNDRLLVYSNDQHQIIPLNSIKYTDRRGLSRIERVLLVPKRPNLIVVVRVPQLTTTNLHEIVIVDIEIQPPKILYCLTEPNDIQNIDLTLNGELVYTVKLPLNKRIASKIYIYNLFN
ncbi:unnamed protein product [Adineta steineri]|uniref:Uncharacterized protein n=2 Tax=Adineta steineri TaxID=433720 RepID=A0A819DCJ0_9BILA|nr:unnamed protein product [Adineta steineri]